MKALSGLLALVVLCASAAGEDPVDVSGWPSDRLKRAYIACDLLSQQQRLDMITMARCGSVATVLLEREFGGDLDRQLRWRAGALAAAREQALRSAAANREP